MKFKVRWFSCLAAITGLVLAVPEKSLGVEACLSARFNDYNDLGCHITADRPGGVPSSCSVCEKKGMPVWWVDEPYINLWISDEPLSYATSSGEPMTFRWTYHERGQVPGPWLMREALGLGVLPSVGGPANTVVLSRYTLNFAGGTNLVMTNAAWGHNWWQEILFWDSTLETQSPDTSYIYQYDPSNPSNATNAYIRYTSTTEGLLFRGDGGVIHFDSSNTNTSTSNGLIVVQVLNQTSLNEGPKIQVPFKDFYEQWINKYPANGLFFVTNAFSGFKVIYPDGSQEIYGLVRYHHDVTFDRQHLMGGGTIGPFPRVSTAGAYMTERRDPQGRVTRIGYQPYFTVQYNSEDQTYSTNFVGYTVGCVVDPDGRTNTYTYYTNIVERMQLPQLVSITDPYGRAAQFTPQSSSGYSTNGFAAITDAQSNTTSFSYPNPTNGTIGSMLTPYGTTTFANYELQENGASNEFEQRAIYVSEPEGAQQLYYYLHHATSGVPTDTNAPGVPGEVLDTGLSGSDSSPHYALTFRDTFHWDRRQFAALSSPVRNTIGSLPAALGYLTANDFLKARLKHWMLGTDLISVTETLSAEREPSMDSEGVNPGAWTWYGNGNYDTAPEIDHGYPTTSMVRLLPDGNSQYVRFNYLTLNPPLVNDSETSVSLPDGSLGERTNWFSYTSPM